MFLVLPQATAGDPEQQIVSGVTEQVADLNHVQHQLDPSCQL